MIQLYDKETGKALGAITEPQLQFLIAQLEEESLADHDYYINRDTLDLFERAGAEAGLLPLLRAAMGDREDMENDQDGARAWQPALLEENRLADSRLPQGKRQ